MRECSSFGASKNTCPVHRQPMQIPLFPLGTVLFPGGVLPLRIFEPRYLTMIGDCMREGSQFGVVLISEGKEAGGPARFHQTGTLATIEDFDQLEDGYLGITCRGGDRFRVSEHRHQDDQLIIASVNTVEEADELQLPDEYPAMKAFLQALCDREELAEWTRTIDPDWDNGKWLSCRLCELLPVSMESRQALLEMDCGSRLHQLATVLLDNNMIES